jgi:anaerobic selenocysteine-containing dehydrogenase
MGSSDKTLKLANGVRPALDAHQQVRLVSGEMVDVDTVFSSLRKELEKWEPEKASRITGLASDVIRSFARDFAKAKSALIIMGYSMCRAYYGDLAQRAQILMASLTGNLGRAGGGWRTLAMVILEGMSLAGVLEDFGLKGLIGVGIKAFRDSEALGKEVLSPYTSSSLFHLIHGGLGDMQLSEEYADPALPRSPASYVEEALAKGHFPIGTPRDAEPPDIVVSAGNNVLRNNRMGDRIRDTLFAKARLVVDINFRMSQTGRHADILLPAAGWYEKIGLKYMISLAPYFTFGDRAVPPLGESKPEWEIYSLLCQRIAAEARKRGVSTIRGFDGRIRDLSKLDTIFSGDGHFGPDAEEDVMRFMLKMSGVSKDVTLEDLRREGAIRIPTLGNIGGSDGIHSDYSPDEPLVPLRDFVEKKNPYPTLTGRQQFYIDHPWYLETGEGLPTHKDTPKMGGDYPLALTAGHARWSIHSMWRDNALMLRLQRGEPIVYLNPDDARERGIDDHDLVNVWNDVNDFTARAKVIPSMQPRQMHIFHAWEPYQFKDGKSHQFLSPSPLRVTQLVGDYGQLHWRMTYWDAGQFDRGTRVDVRKA